MLSKNLNLCFIKQPATIDQPPPQQQDPSSTATSTSSSASLLKTFNSMYDAIPNTNSNSNSTSKSLSLTSDELSVSDSESEPDFSTVFASTRFFFSSPGRSNSIVESSATSPTTSTSADSVITGGVPVPTYSPDPYMDFRRSMQEMVDDRKLYNVTSDWNYLHELLLCYLALNPKHTHKYIFAAFADLLITLTAADKESQTHRKSSEEASSDRCTVE